MACVTIGNIISWPVSEEPVDERSGLAWRDWERKQQVFLLFYINLFIYLFYYYVSFNNVLLMSFIIIIFNIMCVCFNYGLITHFLFILFIYYCCFYYYH